MSHRCVRHRPALTKCSAAAAAIADSRGVLTANRWRHYWSTTSRLTDVHHNSMKAAQETISPRQYGCHHTRYGAMGCASRVSLVFTQTPRWRHSLW